MHKIIFINAKEIDSLYAPLPAKHYIPDWYKHLTSHIDNKNYPNLDGGISATIKKCIPVFDAITAGYIITTHVDIYVQEQDGAPFYSWPSQNAIEFHPIEQAPHHPKQNAFPYPKFINPWGIKTPKGYSLLIISPMHRDNIIEILPGLVDTDKYFSPINFPFVLKDINFRGLIPAGTPIAQVIPIKRSLWKSLITNKNKPKQQIIKISSKLRSVFYNGYKSFFWTKKHYN